MKKALLILILTWATLYKAEAENSLGHLEFHSENSSFAAVLMDTNITARVAGPIASVEITQHFANNSANWLEGVYRQPLPDGAAVHGLEITVGDTVLKGLLKEKEQAQKTYEAAKSNGQQAAIMNENAANLFHTRIANIPPWQEIAVRIKFDVNVDLNNHEFHLRLPLTYTPRYVNGGESGENNLPVSSARVNQQVVLQVYLDPGVRVSQVSSPTHQVDILPDNNGYFIQFSQGLERADHDFELTWTPDIGNEPIASLMSEKVGDSYYSLLLISPPEIKQENTSARELILILDHSGSMHGEAMDQTKQAAHFAVNTLRDVDYFNVVGFSSDSTALFSESLPASQLNIDQAHQFISNLESNGGTNILTAVENSMNRINGGQSLVQMIMMTDGSVENEDEVIRLAHDSSDQAHFFPVAIGPSPNDYFIRAMARNGNGVDTFINNISQVDQQMQHLLTKLSVPTTTNISLAIPNLKNNITQKIPDLYSGQVIYRLIQSDTPLSSIHLDGKQASSDWKVSLGGRDVDVAGAISRLWARQQIQLLMDDAKLAGLWDKNRDQVLELALKHQLVSPYTSFVVVAEEPVRPKSEPLHSKKLALAHVAMASTAGNGRLFLFLFFVGITFIVIGKRLRDI